MCEIRENWLSTWKIARIWTEIWRLQLQPYFWWKSPLRSYFCHHEFSKLRVKSKCLLVSVWNSRYLAFRFYKLRECELKQEECKYNINFEGSLLWYHISAITNYLKLVLNQNICWMVYEIRENWLSDLTNCENWNRNRKTATTTIVMMEVSFAIKFLL